MKQANTSSNSEKRRDRHHELFTNPISRRYDRRQDLGLSACITNSISNLVDAL